jgi:hypothetical protein
MCLVGGVEDGCSLGLDGFGSAVMGVLEAAEPFRELGPILERLELGL